MKANQRRQAILEILSHSDLPISASQLASRFQVSRQIIVGDIALLRASNHDILSTPKGYLLSQNIFSHQFKGKIACCHGADDTEEELRIIVEKGGQVLDVKIEHPIYGMLTAALNIRNHEDAADFTKKMKESQASLLSDLTQGIHLHTISCPSKKIFDEIKQTLAKQGFLLEEE